MNQQIRHPFRRSHAPAIISRISPRPGPAHSSLLRAPFSEETGPAVVTGHPLSNGHGSAVRLTASLRCCAFVAGTHQLLPQQPGPVLLVAGSLTQCKQQPDKPGLCCVVFRQHGKSSIFPTSRPDSLSACDLRLMFPSGNIPGELFRHGLCLTGVLPTAGL